MYKVDLDISLPGLLEKIIMYNVKKDAKQIDMAELGEDDE